MKEISFIIRYLIHFFEAKNTKGHGVHSPYLFRFTQNVIYDKNPFYIFPAIEKLRVQLRRDERLLHLTDFGTGNHSASRVCDIAKKSLKTPNRARLLFRTVHFIQAKTVLELGTSLGITTAYLASPNSDLVAAVARENFEKLGLKNIRQITGNIDNTLEPFLQENKTLDVVFFDANHRQEAVLRYFNLCVKHITRNSVFIVDDIHWSADMEDAWFSIQNHPEVQSSIDLFDCGMVFFDRYLPKKHFKMR
ncbi:MAG: O-methyltransferase-like protein [Bacteroidetes bacterium]|nr:O-methyltransferase-like protein [Bacteroidota bacterium]